MIPGMDATADDASRLAALRELLPATSAGIYLATTAAGPFPAETDRALADADAWELRVGRAGPDRADDLAQRSAEARAVVAAVLGTDPARVLLGGGAAALVGAFAASLARREQERLVTLGAVAQPIRGAMRAAAFARGAEFVELPFPADTAVAGACGRGDALVAISLVDPDTGELRSMDGVAARAHETDAAVLVDGSLCVGAMPLSPAALGVDALVVEAGHWLLGPDGTAVMWLAPTTEPSTRRRIEGSIDSLPRRSLLGLARSLGWLLMVVGLPWAQARTRRTADLLLDGLADIEGVELRTPPARSGVSAVFGITGWTTEQAQDELGARVFAILDRTADGEALVASVGAWTTEAELARFLGAVSELAAHTHTSLPRRPTLMVLAAEPADAPT
jgi:selenocysteine lyase/cysteine desulfurase